MNKLSVPSKYIGIPFQENGTDVSGINCIHLAKMFVEEELGVKVTPLPPDIRHAQKNHHKYANLLEPIGFNELIPGDVPFFAFPGERWHCGVYVGYGKMLHTIRPIFENKRSLSLVSPILPQWQRYYIGAIRTKDKKEIVVPDAGDLGTVLLIISIVISVFSTVYALVAPKPKFGNDTGSPKYGFDALDNTISNELIYPMHFGDNKYAGNFIWEKNDGGDTVQRILMLGVGKIHSVRDVRVNDIPIEELPGCSYTAYLGTPDQTVDSRTGGEVKGLRNRAYLAVTLKSSDKLPGGRMTITCRTEGLEMKTWSGSSWTGSNYSRIPAAALRHLFIMPREDGGGGAPESDIDDTAFGEVYDYQATLISDGAAGTHPRHQFDFVFDAQKPFLDAVREILQPYGMYLLLGEKISLKILKAEDPVCAFDMSNIKAGTFKYYYASKDESLNEVHVKYSDPDQNDVLIDAPARDNIDQAKRGVYFGEFNYSGINRFAEASRRAEFIKNDSIVNVIWCEFDVDIDALHCTVGDVGTVTHELPGWVGKPFRIHEITEEKDFTRHVVAREETSSIHNDAMGSVIDKLDYGSPANPYAPVTDVTNLQASEGAYYLHKDGKVGSDINVSWTPPSDATKKFIKEYIIELKKGAGTYKEVGRTTGAALTIYGVEDEVTYNIKVKINSINDIISTGVISSDLTILGKLNPPSIVTGFDVSQEGNFLRFSWLAISDPDFARYIIKKGSEWNTGQIIAEKTDTTEFMYPVGEVGVVTFMIKAADTSGNESTAPAIDTITIVPPPEMNFINDFDLWSQNFAYKLSNLELVYTNDYDLGYVRPALCLKTVNTWESREAEAKTWEQQETDGGLALNGTVQSSGSYEMISPIDLGTIFEFKAILDADYRNVTGGSLEVQISYSSDGITYSSFATVNAATTYLGRYVKFKFVLSTTDTTQQVYFYGCSIYITAPVTKMAWFRDVAIPIGGKTILFGVNFTYPPRVTVNVVNGVIGFAVASNKTANQCDVFVYDASGAAIGTAEVDVDVKGY